MRVFEAHGISLPQLRYDESRKLARFLQADQIFSFSSVGNAFRALPCYIQRESFLQLVKGRKGA
jgi:hypothetical protein